MQARALMGQAAALDEGGAQPPGLPLLLLFIFTLYYAFTEFMYITLKVRLAMIRSANNTSTPMLVGNP
ncbi:hypothetical protein KDA_42820 [Dictyobacter alpinus]|uniref:Uncharacterized protein n=1 Tax=Dictyobacter alpinus TaxID=2014873 RepID=A0A402BBJ6_9CHLR|nr:hypothetical protein KDA_42820 [Dictyobacter alpinus]